MAVQKTSTNIALGPIFSQCILTKLKHWHPQPQESMTTNALNIHVGIYTPDQNTKETMGIEKYQLYSSSLTNPNVEGIFPDK